MMNFYKADNQRFKNSNFIPYFKSFLYFKQSNNERLKR